MNNTQQLKDGMRMGMIYLLLLLVVVFLPGSELFALFVLPIPFVLYASRYGYLSTLLLGGLVLIISVILSLFLFTGTLPLTLLAISAGTFIGHAIHQKRHPYETWALGTVGMTIGLLLIFVMVQLLSQVNLVDQYQLVVEESIETTKSMAESTGLPLGAEELDVIEKQMNQIITLFPSILVFISIGLAFTTQWLSYKVILWQDKKRLAFPPFRTFSLPKGVIWLYLGTVLLAFLPIGATGSLEAVIVNTTNLMGVLFSLQGISVILFYSHQKRLSNAFPILIILSCIIFLPIGLYLTRILGIIDIGFDLKEKMKQTK